MGNSSGVNILQSVSAFLLGATSVVLIMLWANNGSLSLEKLFWSNETHVSTTSSSISQELNTTELAANAQQEIVFKDLPPLLERVTTDDKTIIMTSVNEAWAAPNSLLDMFLESFHTGEKIEHLLSHLMIVALDAKAFDRCKLVHPHCFWLQIVGKNFSSEKYFMTEGYVDLVWSKVDLQRRILQLGYNFLFTDVDILWFRNPFKHITVFADFTVSCDYYNGNPDEIRNFPNTGFIYVKSNNKTIQMMRYWHEARGMYPPDHEQNIFNKIKQDVVDRMEMKVQYIDTVYCGGFCSPGKDLNKICTMHANCCMGLDRKLHDLRSLMEDWKNYTSLSIEEKKKGQHTWRVPGKCIR